MFYTSSSTFGNPNKKFYSKSNPYCQDFVNSDSSATPIPCLATEGGSFISTEDGTYIALENDIL